MNKLPSEYDENVRHRKKSKTSKTSKSVRRSNHKHEYENVILREWLGYAWGGRCKLCGKFQSHYGQFSSARYADFRKPSAPGVHGVSFLNLEDIRAKFPNVPIYVFSDEDMQHRLVP